MGSEERQGPQEQIEHDLLDLSEVCTQATEIARATIDYYSSDDRYGVVDERGSDGNGTVVVSMQYEAGSEECLVKFQELAFQGGLLVEAYANNGAYLYQFDYDEGTIWLNTSVTSNGNRQWHEVRCVITPEEQELSETTRVQGSTDINAFYGPFIEDGVAGFQLEAVRFSGCPLLDEDVARFLPNGRFITLEDLLHSAINPHRSVERVPEIIRADGFPELGYSQIGPHSSGSVKYLDGDRDVIYGYSHPLKDNPNEWLVFVRFNGGSYAVGRALRVKVDRESVQVEDHEDVPTIMVQASVNGEEVFDLSIPTPSGSWEERTQENEALATKIEDDRVWIPMNAEELYQNIDERHYTHRMVDGVVTAFYEKYYAG